MAERLGFEPRVLLGDTAFRVKIRYLEISGIKRN